MKWPSLLHWKHRAGSRAEVFAVAAGVAGWLLITLGIAPHVGWTAWPISIGMITLAAYGIRPLLRTFWFGAWPLHEAEKRARAPQPGPQ